MLKQKYIAGANYDEVDNFFFSLITLWKYSYKFIYLFILGDKFSELVKKEKRKPRWEGP